jgi:hypothetical protein
MPPVQSRAPELCPEDAHALTLFRALSDDRGRQYTGVTFRKQPRAGCELFIRRALGHVGRWPMEEFYAVLDVLNVEGDVVTDFPIPDAASFRWVKQRLNLRVEETDSAEARRV